MDPHRRDGMIHARHAARLAFAFALSACGGEPGESMTKSQYKTGPDQQVTQIEGELPAAKLTFRLVQDESGYPGVGYESMWARRLPDGTFEIDNIPFYSYDVAVGDIVKAQEVDGELFFSERVRDSGNSVIRMLIYNRDELDKVRSELRALGCDSEGDGVVLAVNVPAEVAYAPILQFLTDGDRAKRWGFEEAVLCHTVETLPEKRSLRSARGGLGKGPVSRDRGGFSR